MTLQRNKQVSVIPLINLRYWTLDLNNLTVTTHQEPLRCISYYSLLLRLVGLLPAAQQRGT